MIIYKTTCLINGLIYIGKDSKNNQNYLGSGKKLKKAFEKYGKNNFVKEIIEDNIKTKEMLDEREIYWIAYYNSTNRKIGYNLSCGGSPMGGIKYSKRYIKKLCKNHVGFIGKKHSEETKNKMSVDRKGRKNHLKLEKE